MILTEQPRYTFYPDVNGNLSLPETEQLAVEIIRPTGFQTKEMKTVSVSREYYRNDQPLTDDGKPRDVLKYKKITTDIKINGDYILRSCVGKITNLQVKVGDEIRDIKNGIELAECRAYGVTAIVDAICNEVLADELTDSKKKTLE